jgi:hypothetical protein
VAHAIPTLPTFGDPRLPERFWAKAEPAESGCWRWTASLTAAGYGQIALRTATPIVAHKWAYLALVGEVPEGETLDHRCHTDDSTCTGGSDCQHRRCVNPAHLEPVARGENVRRGRRWMTPPAERSCVNGHPYGANEENRGQSGCRICSVESSRRSKAKKKERANA